MIDLRLAIRLAAMAAVVLVGAGACTFDPQGHQDRAGAPDVVSGAGGTTGASGSPGPTRLPAPTLGAPTPAVRTVEAPSPTAKPSVPVTPSRTAAPAPHGSTAPAGCPQGERQREVEASLARLGGFGPITVDGRQSAADCAAIRKFQQRYGIQPALGRAGATTADVANRLATTDTSTCHAGSGTTFCVDLTRQTVWVMRDGAVVMAPTVTRTGMAGYATTAGTYSINERNAREWSTPYQVWLPLWQHFNHGMGFHQTTTYLHDKSIGSHGCVNLLPVDAQRMWDLGRIGTTVRLFGRRPGT